jgi:hypothetical protein
MNILDLKQFHKFVDHNKVKVLRHRSSNEDLWQLVNSNRFTQYQNSQSWDVFGDAEYIISFIAERYKYAKFVGVWKIIKKNKLPRSTRYKYRTKPLPDFDELKKRLIVKWGDGTRSWAQWLHRQGNKEISEILPKDYIMDFPGFYDFTLDYDDLKTMINNPDSNREWYRMLSSISGVYIILDNKNGKQYIGSAYGRGGIWGRWKSYAKNPHGGNKLLIELLKDKPRRHRYFQFSILRVLEPSATKDEVIRQEKLAKKKLGSRAFGLNSN